MVEIEVRDGPQVAEARRAAVKIAQANGFDETDAGRVAIVATELATNIVKHGGGGVMLVGGYDDASGRGVECVALDKGAGMVDVEVCMQDGYSTAGSLGQGLGAVSRGSQVMDIQSTRGSGTAVLARMEAGRVSKGAPRVAPGYGAVSVPMRGEESCGDGWCRHDTPDGFAVMVADGLGHGLYASEAAHAASRVFRTSSDRMPSETLASMHAALRPTRGAAVAIAQVDRAGGNIQYAGVGNIAACIVGADGTIRRLVSLNGTIGHVALAFRDFSYPILGDALLVMTSDGVGTGWRIDAYPGLWVRHPTLIAAVLYRDFARGRDDATVFVARVEAE